ncbi:hypothetical protein [Corynebacterium halotolerans]|uniref:hypothetical protein n=1 Tax=Corynebacterium halotolerans TaxID=225326 RepID=UPI003CE9B7D0
MSSVEPQDPSPHRRRKLQMDSFTGFLGFFAVLSVIQAVINVVQPEPKVWPAVLALILVIATVVTWRAGRR